MSYTGTYILEFITMGFGIGIMYLLRSITYSNKKIKIYNSELQKDISPKLIQFPINLKRNKPYTLGNLLELSENVSLQKRCFLISEKSTSQIWMDNIMVGNENISDLAFEEILSELSIVNNIDKIKLSPLGISHAAVLQFNSSSKLIKNTSVEDERLVLFNLNSEHLISYLGNFSKQSGLILAYMLSYKLTLISNR